MILVVIAVVGVGVYLYSRMDNEIRFHVQETLVDVNFPHLNVSVGGARLVENQGIAIHNLVISETTTNQLQNNLLVIDELLLECDVELSQLVRGPPQIRRILVRHPEVWVSRELNGNWNLAVALASAKLWQATSTDFDRGCPNHTRRPNASDGRTTLAARCRPHDPSRAFVALGSCSPRR